MMWPYTDEESDFISFGRLPSINEEDQDQDDEVGLEPTEATT